MAHSTAVLFAHLGRSLGHWLLHLPDEDKPSRDDAPRSPAPVRLDAERGRLPPHDESFYWAWQYWSQ
ncbi:MULTISPECIES: hypothetical protein [unclassified Mesorhizobium]|uniref:hypothetical protein n=1 Tax=unclassified Mesorhizobium TaxID=325217 RepID=UPI0024163082|nr:MULTISPECIES: hypothetical protein [unclassified Mesorhizobium]WFP63754.1 hypothetical protein QAZ47_04000 [Mesorhizobium sp. WSM4904]WFP77025.1 hypothetical protein QAZ22_04020 [Mesorhizobium sp. WSM4906]